MKRYYISAAIVLFLLSGCLSFKAIEYRITFDKKFQTAKIKISYEDIGSDKFISSEKDTEMTAAERKEILQDRKDDFAELLGMIRDDKQLLNGVEQGIYFKKRYLFEKGGKLNGCYEGIFKNLKFEDEGESLRVLKNEILLTLSKDTDIERMETNGTLRESEDMITISWPKTQNTLYWRRILKENGKTLSLLDEYRKWKSIGKK